MQNGLRETRLGVRLPPVEIYPARFYPFSTYPRFSHTFKILDSPKARRTNASKNIRPIYLYLYIIIYRGECIYGGEHSPKTLRMSLGF